LQYKVSIANENQFVKFGDGAGFCLTVDR